MRQNHDLQQFKQTYLGGVFPKQMRYNFILVDGLDDNIDDATGLEEEHNGSALLPNFYKYRANIDILKCTIDSPQFSLTEYSTEVLLTYHKRWTVFYIQDRRNDRSGRCGRNGEMVIIAAEKGQQASLSATRSYTTGWTAA